MEENEKVKVESENVGNNTEKVKGKNKKITVVLTVVILVLVLGIGVCAGILLAKGDTNIFNITEQKQEENVTIDNDEELKENAEISEIPEQVNKSDNDTAITEIKKCLKDIKWLEENVMVINAEGKIVEQSLNFIKLKSDTNYPLIIIEAFSDEIISSKVTMVTYSDGKVVNDTLLSYPQTSVWVDANNRIVKFFRGPYQGENVYNYMTISGGKVSNSEWVIKPEAIENKYYYGNLNIETQECSKEKFDSIVSTYEKYNYVEIGTELTDSNIDKYIIDVYGKKQDSNNNEVGSSVVTENKNEFSKYYIEKINELEELNKDYELKYGLAYINEDDIPELVVDNGGMIWTYTYKDNKGKLLNETSYGTHGRGGYEFVEKGNIIREFATDQNGYAYEIYDELFQYKYSASCTFDGKYYNHLDKEITESEYNELIYSNKKFISVTTEVTTMTVEEIKEKLNSNM